jgi:hypothetical protein
MGSPACRAGRRQEHHRPRGCGAAAEGRRPRRPDPRAECGATEGHRAGLAGSGHGAGPAGLRDCARRDEHPGGRAAPVPLAAGVRAAGLGQHPAPHSGDGRCPGRGPDRARPRRNTPRGVDAARPATRRLPLDLGVRPGAGRLVRPGPGRDHRHLHQQEGGRGGHFQGRLRAHAAGGVGGQHPRVRRDAAAARQRPAQRRRRPQDGAGHPRCANYPCRCGRSCWSGSTARPSATMSSTTSRA